MSAIAVQPHRSAATQDSEEAASRLFTEHSEQVFGYCLHQLRSRAEAEDATQTTFLHALRALRRGVVPECESAWLTTIAKNVCHSERRTIDRRGPLAPEVDLDTIALAQTGEDEEELLLGFKEALASMPESQRRALVLREWQGVPSREIASQLGLSATATHALLTRARHSFAQALTLPGRPVAGLVWLALELRSHLKALLGGATTKAVVTSVAVIAIGVGAGGVVVDRGLADSKAPPAPARSTNRPANQSTAAELPVPRGTSPSRDAARARTAASRTSSRDTVSTPATFSETRAVAPPSPPLAGRPDATGPVPADGPRPDPGPTPPPLDLPVVPSIGPPQLPDVELPAPPPVTVPSLPAADLPPVPPLPLPSEAPPIPAVPLP